MKPLKDYSFIRGVCHNMRRDATQMDLERELGFCRRLNLNSVRFWMKQEDFEKNPDEFIDYVGNFMRTCWKFGLSSMPIFWNGNETNEFTEPSEEDYDKARSFAKAIIDAFRNEEYVLMWDVMNEPFCNQYLLTSPKEEYQARYQKLRCHLRRLCEIVRDIDSENCLTVGHELVKHCESTNDIVDVISYHDYLTTRADMEGVILGAKAFGEQWGKPILNTETGCVGRSNPYDIELELAAKHKVGWYLFNLITEGFWGEIHGLVYPDGSIRDPAVIAALFGFFRNRTENRIKVNANREGYAYRAVKAVEDVLNIQRDGLFTVKEKTTDDILEAAEFCVNILEGAEMVPMWNPPSARIECWRRTPAEKRDVYEIKQFAYEMAQLVRKNFYF